MKIKIIATPKEKKAALIISVVVLFIAWLINRRYLYVTDAEFENDEPVSFTLKTGFIFSVKTKMNLTDGNYDGKIKFYDHKYSIKKEGDTFCLYIRSKKVYTIYGNQYYEDNKKEPTGRIYLKK